MPAPQRQPERPGLLRRWREPWRRFPELRDVPPGWSAKVYARASWRMWRGVSAWAALAIVLATFGLCALPLVLIGLGRSPFWLLVGPALGGLLGALLRRLTDPALARCVRLELGTHCPACDHDLRTTPDPAGPRHARCPECGKAIDARAAPGPPVPTDGEGANGR